MNKALLIVDIQNDFLPNGALSIKGSDQIIPIINDLQKHFDHILATKDWHPQNHKSFAIHHDRKSFEVIEYHGLLQELWPVHCVQNSRGAEFAATLDTKRIKQVFYKGKDPEVDSYSAFFDNAHIRSTGLLEYLNEHQIDEVFIVGLAIDYCVKYSVLDAIQHHLKVTVIKDACCGVGLQPGDIEQSWTIMEAVGARLINSKEIE